MKRTAPDEQKSNASSVLPIVLLNLVFELDLLTQQRAADCKACKACKIEDTKSTGIPANEKCFSQNRLEEVTINCSFKSLPARVPNAQDDERCASACPDVQLKFPSPTKASRGLKWLMRHSKLAQDATLADVVDYILSAAYTFMLSVPPPPPLSSIAKKISSEDLRFRCFRAVEAVLLKVFGSVAFLQQPVGGHVDDLMFLPGVAPETLPERHCRFAMRSRATLAPWRFQVTHERKQTIVIKEHLPDALVLAHDQGAGKGVKLCFVHGELFDEIPASGAIPFNFPTLSDKFPKLHKLPWVTVHDGKPSTVDESLDLRGAGWIATQNHLN